MYAVIKTGGKQYKVSEGTYLKIETLRAADGETVEFDDVLMIADGDDVKIGTPILKGGKVTGKILSHGRGDKVKIIKFRRRKHHRKQMGHRQNYTKVLIEKIAS